MVEQAKQLPPAFGILMFLIKTCLVGVYGIHEMFFC